MRCVCGDRFADHKPVVMSVPLTADKPALYPIKAGYYGNNITTVHPRSSYESVECVCGCTSWEPFHE